MQILYLYTEGNEIGFFFVLEMTANGYLSKKYLFSCTTMKLQQVFTNLCSNKLKKSYCPVMPSITNFWEYCPARENPGFPTREFPGG